MKRKYTVNVHYDVVLSTTVIAEDEDEAIEMAEERLSAVDLSEGESVGEIGSCVTDVQELGDLDGKLLIYLGTFNDHEDLKDLPTLTENVKAGLGNLHQYTEWPKIVSPEQLGKKDVLKVDGFLLLGDIPNDKPEHSEAGACEDLFVDVFKIIDHPKESLDRPALALTEIIRILGTDNVLEIEDGPSLTFFDDDNNGYTDTIQKIRLDDDGNVDAVWEGERSRKPCWERLYDKDGIGDVEEDFLSDLLDAIL